MRFSQSWRRRGRNDMDTAVIRFKGTTDELGQPGQFQAADVEPTSTAARDLGEKPAQMNPDVQQKEAQRNQHETVGGILRGRPAADLAGAAVARFDAEAAAVLAARQARRPIQLDQNE